MIFLIINPPNFVYLLVDPGFLSFFTLKFLYSIAVRSPIGYGRTWQTQRTKRQMNERTNWRTNKEMRLFVRPSVRLS